MPLLSDPDSRAVDLLLNKRKSPKVEREGSDAAAPAPESFANLSDGEFRHRLSKVGDLLSLLQQLPADDPPNDLVGKTLERIQHQKASPAPAGPELKFPQTDKPHA